jgi:hypothetical protein
VTLKLVYSGNLGRRQVVLFGFALPLAFAAIVLAVLGLLPAPHTRIHYLIAGTTATCIGLVAAALADRKRSSTRFL